MAAVRELLYTLNLRSHSSRGRIVIFNDAEHLSLQAANAILKTLEEPRPFTHFVLIAASPSKLPATIVSRCQVWCFDSLSAGQIQEILTHRERSASAEGPAQSIPPSELAELADGSLDSLDQIGAHYERWMTIKDLLARMLEGDLEIALRAAQDLGKSKESLRAQIHLLRIRSRQQMHSPRGSATARTRTQRRWATLLSNLIAAERLIFERNLSPVLVLSAVFAAFTTQHQSFALAELPNLEDIVV